MKYLIVIYRMNKFSTYRLQLFFLIFIGLFAINAA
jgi:hypothetical protein